MLGVIITASDINVGGHCVHWYQCWGLLVHLQTPMLGVIFAFTDTNSGDYYCGHRHHVGYCSHLPMLGVVFTDINVGVIVFTDINAGGYYRCSLKPMLGVYCTTTSSVCNLIHCTKFSISNIFGCWGVKMHFYFAGLLFFRLTAIVVLKPQM